MYLTFVTTGYKIFYLRNVICSILMLVYDGSLYGLAMFETVIALK